MSARASANREGAARPSPTGPLVRERLRELSASAAREDARWAAGFLERVNTIAPETLAHEDSTPLRTVSTGFAAAALKTADERLRYLDGLQQVPVMLAQIETTLRGQMAHGIVRPTAQVDAIVSMIRSFAAASAASPFAVPRARLEPVTP